MMSTVSEKLLQVAQNNPKVYHSGQLNIVKNAECLKGSKSGFSILLDDVSPVSHEMGVRVRGKNLFDKSTLQTDGYTKNLTQINNGFTFETNTTKATMSVACDIFLNVGTYYCSGTVSSSDDLKGGWGVYDPIKKVYIINNSSRGTVNDKFTITESKTYNLSFFASYNSVADVTMTFTNIQLELGTTATAYTPYVPDLTAFKVTRCGKNLFDYDSVIFKANVPSAIITKENNGFTFTALSSSAYFNTSNISAFCLKPNTTYTSRATVTLIDNGTSNIGESGSMGLSLLLQTNVTYDSSGKGKIYIVDGYQNNTGVFSTVGTHEIITTFTTPADMTDFKYIVTRASNNTTVIFKNLQIQLGITATDYEPYITPTDYTPTADGTVNGVTSLYPNTTLMTDTDGVLIDCEYYKDIDKTFNELTTSVALSGGDS